MDNGLVQIYCGNGKGKTTAAIGLGIRAIGQNLKVIMIQFLKDADTGECKTLKSLEPKFKVFHFEKARGFTWTLTPEEKEEKKEEIKNAINFARKVLDTGECDILILDEILGAIEAGLIDEEEICDLIDNKPEGSELVLTGRVLPDEIAKRANYISKINAIKHPIDQGIGARKGIEF
ncbi:MAG: cob(I)yrinic acid a,c-diamide adenosyltransferase [Epulopiscium sp.]|nr:cob(I)yrinic acid a,c-diamide adenosyltransferase [Candidatus Epulonipiscium sp.]